jgi:hypothetical protein
MPQAPQVDPVLTVVHHTTLEPEFIFDVQPEVETKSDAEFLLHIDPAFKPENRSKAKKSVVKSHTAAPPLEPSFHWYNKLLF